MILREPCFIENFCQDQPYNSMVLIAPYCYNSCTNCQNQHLMKNPVTNFDVSALIKIYQANPFLEGITVAGLEPHHCSATWWSELQRFITEANISKVTIYTSETIKKEIYTDELYYKTGEYIQTLPCKTVTINDWEIKLGSSNQNFELVYKKD